MDNIAILDNPYTEGISISTRGVAVEAKAAKLNNTTKRPVLVGHWKEQRPNNFTQTGVKSGPKDYSKLLNSVGITIVKGASKASNSGAKKLRVNKVVNIKTSNVYKNSERVDVIPMKEEKNAPLEPIAPVSTPAVERTPEPVVEEKPPVPLENAIQSSRLDIHGRHERTGEVPVEAVREAIRNDSPVSTVSRVERNSANIEMPVREDVKQESKAGDMDLYNNLLHSEGQEDVSRQLQGARKELSKEKEESRKLAEQYGEAVKELKILKEDVENKKKEKAQRERRELSETLNNIETLKKENLDRTSDLSSIRAEIERLRAERDSMGSDFYDDYRTYGRSA